MGSGFLIDRQSYRQGQAIRGRQGWRLLLQSVVMGKQVVVEQYHWQW